jgi:hypothetical protein
MTDTDVHEQVKEQLARANQDYDAKLAQAHQKAAAILEQAQERAKAQEAEIVAQARQEASAHRSTFLNRILLALCVGVWLGVVLLYFTSVADGVITFIAIFVGLVTYLFPKVKEIHRQSWFRAPLTTSILSIGFAIGGMIDVYLWLKPEQVIPSFQQPAALGQNNILTAITFLVFEPESNSPEWITHEGREVVKVSLETSKDFAFSGNQSIRGTIPISPNGKTIFSFGTKRNLLGDYIIGQIYWPDNNDINIAWASVCVKVDDVICEAYTVKSGAWNTFGLNLTAFGPENRDISNTQISEIRFIGEIRAKNSTPTPLSIYVDSIQIFNHD